MKSGGLVLPSYPSLTRRPAPGVCNFWFLSREDGHEKQLKSKFGPLAWGEGGDPALAGEPGEGLLLQTPDPPSYLGHPLPYRSLCENSTFRLGGSAKGHGFIRAESG